MTVTTPRTERTGTRMPRPDRLSATELAELGAALRRVAGRRPLERLFGGERVPPGELTRHLPARQLRRLEACRLVDDFGDGLESPFQLHVVEELVILTDPDVPDEEQAPTYLDPLWEGKTLARLLVRGRMGTALDVGVGSGVLSLVLSRYAERVVGIDLNPRALAVSRFNAALNGIDRLELVEGDLFEPLSGRRFDRIVFNSPTDHEEQRYHGLLMAGEGILRRFFERLPRHLSDDGFAQLNLAMNDYPDSPFSERLETWLGDASNWLEFLLLVLETRNLAGGRIWRRGWLTCRPGTARWTRVPNCPYNTLPDSLTPDAISDLLVWIMDERGRFDPADRPSRERPYAER
ncbi:MAG: methyltransferase [Acidobacteriota bacterium]|jgi:SAM-dependent methyltransferase